MTAPWSRFVTEAPEFARAVRGRIEEHGLAFLATLAADGSPRISGLEPIFFDGELWLAMMPRSVKGKDLRRDGRFALHNASVDKDVSQGDVKINGVAAIAQRHRAARIPEVGPEADLFGVDLTRVSSVRVSDGHLVIDMWRPGGSVVTRKRT